MPQVIDKHIPISIQEVEALLRRRIEVHHAWRDRLRDGDERAQVASDYGAGTVESHQTYADQYEASIDLISRLRADLDEAVGLLRSVATKRLLRPHGVAPEHWRRDHDLEGKVRAFLARMASKGVSDDQT